jgi:type IV pilus assembly protein PilW
MTRQKGFTLIELMLSMSLGLILLIGIFNVLLINLQSYRVQASVSRIQEVGRHVLEELAINIRNSGHRGCVRGNANFVSWLNSNYFSNFNQAVVGYNAEVSGWSTTLPNELGTVSAGTDVLSIAGAIEIDAVIAEAMTDPLDTTIKVRESQASFVSGDLVIFSDCLTSDLFETGGSTSDGAGNAVIANNVTTGTQPGNTAQPMTKAYDAGDHIYRHLVTSYFVAASGQGTGNALWRRVGTRPAEELVEGVDQLQIEFAVDTNGDGAVDSYVAPGAANLNQIIAARVFLLLRSLDNLAVDADTRTFTFAGETFGPFNDRATRQLFVKTVAIRNRLR